LRTNGIITVTPANATTINNQLVALGCWNYPQLVRTGVGVEKVGAAFGRLGLSPPF
jgi:hypothetical protein